MLHDIRQQFLHFFFTIRSWLVIYLLLSFLLFSSGVGEYSLWGKTGYFFSFQGDSFAAQLFKKLVTDIVPASVPIIVTSPLTAFVIQVKIALLAALILTLPLLLYMIGSFVAPALYRRERTILRAVVVAASLLFFIGSVFSYHYIVPTTLQVLYTFAEPIGVTTMLSSDALLAVVFALIFVTGVAFTLPVMMVVLSMMGVVSPAVWVMYWRHVLVAIFIVSAIITPDGSGVSMVLLSVPTTILYGCGIVISHMVARPSSEMRVTRV
jgi:sec-independent protein translocase protein TatC